MSLKQENKQNQEIANEVDSSNLPTSVRRFKTTRMSITSKILYGTAERYEQAYLYLKLLRDRSSETSNFLPNSTQSPLNQCQNRDQEKTLTTDLENSHDVPKTLDLNWQAPKFSITPSFAHTNVSEPSESSLKKECIRFLETDNPNFPPNGVALSDVYTLLKKIGEGGNGRIYLAKDNNLDIFCAIKILVFRGANREENKKRFYREIKTTARLRHPNIVNIFYANHVQDYFYYVMEYIKGKTCDQISQERPVSEEEIVKIAIPLAEALQYAHQNSIIHRDIKPANIMIDENGTVKLLDLGLAISFSFDETRKQSEKQIVGTPYYLSPEQARAEIAEIDERTDVYSFGATLYHLLTGIPPFKGKNIYETISMVLNPDHQPKNPRILKPEITEKMSNLILKCMAKNPAKRFLNMQQVLAALHTIMPNSSRSDSPACSF